MLKMFGLNICLEVQNPAGDIVHRHSEPGHSWVKNGYGMLLYGLASASSVLSDLTNTYGGEFDEYYGQDDNCAITSFIRIGTSSTAFSVNDYELVAKVSDLDLNITSLSKVTPSYSTKVWTARSSQSFTNDSDEAKIIRELGFYHERDSSISDVDSYLLSRDVLSSSVSLPVGYILTVHYDITMDLSAVD